MSIETLALLLAYKVKFPDRITLLRGNHEARQICEIYGFYEECFRRFHSLAVWHKSTEVFDALPLAAVINNQVFCVHGGLSPDIQTLDQVSILQRFQEIPFEGAMCDLLWADPDENVSGWSVPRSAGWIFGALVVKQFCHVNGLNLICRAHQLQTKGYKYYLDRQLLSVWSAPNYCYRCGNDASVVGFDENLVQTPKVFQHDVASHEEQARLLQKHAMYFI